MGGRAFASLVLNSLLLPAPGPAHLGSSQARVDRALFWAVLHLVLSFPHSYLQLLADRASFEIYLPGLLFRLSHLVVFVSSGDLSVSKVQTLRYRLRAPLDDLATRWRRQIWTRLRDDHASVFAVLDLETRGRIIVNHGGYRFKHTGNVVFTYHCGL